MDIITQLENLKAQGKKVVSIDFMIKELRGIPPTRQQTVRKGSKEPYDSICDNNIIQAMKTS